jgi:hypothetical protein
MAFHTSNRPDDNSISSALKELKLEPVIGPMRSQLDQRLRALGISASVFAGNLEVYASAEPGFRTVITRSREARRKEAPLLEVLLVTNHEFADDFISQLQAKFPTTLNGHSSHEVELLATLKKQLGELSPNGKLLCHDDIRSASAELSNDELRRPLKEIASAF